MLSSSPDIIVCRPSSSATLVTSSAAHHLHSRRPFVRVFLLCTVSASCRPPLSSHHSPRQSPSSPGGRSHLPPALVACRCCPPAVASRPPWLVVASPPPVMPLPPIHQRFSIMFAGAFNSHCTATSLAPLPLTHQRLSRAFSLELLWFIVELGTPIWHVHPPAECTVINFPRIGQCRFDHFLNVFRYMGIHGFRISYNISIFFPVIAVTRY